MLQKRVFLSNFYFYTKVDSGHLLSIIGYMKVLVTGGSGFLGSHIVNFLIKRGIAVRSMGRSLQPVLQVKGVECVQGDIALLSDVETAIKGVDIVFHTAGYAGMTMNRTDYFRTNYIGTKNIVNSCKKFGISKLIYTSSPAVVFNGQAFEGSDESLPIQKHYHWDYARTKAKAEEYVLKNNSPELKTVAIRPHLILGVGDRHLMPHIINRVRKRKLRIVGDGDNKVDITFVQNAAHAHLLALDNIDRAAGKAYFIGQERPVNLWDFINEICERLGYPKVTKKVSVYQAYHYGRFLETFYRVFFPLKTPPLTRALAVALGKSHYFSHERARQDLGYKPLFPIEIGLEDIVKNFQNRLKLPYGS